MNITRVPEVVSQRIKEIQKARELEKHLELIQSVKQKAQLYASVGKQFQEQFNAEHFWVDPNQPEIVTWEGLQLHNILEGEWHGAPKDETGQFIERASSSWWLYAPCPECGKWRPYRQAIRSLEDIARAILDENWDEGEECDHPQEGENKIRKQDHLQEARIALEQMDYDTAEVAALIAIALQIRAIYDLINNLPYPVGR